MVIHEQIRRSHTVLGIDYVHLDHRDIVTAVTLMHHLVTKHHNVVKFQADGHVTS